MEFMRGPTTKFRLEQIRKAEIRRQMKIEIRFIDDLSIFSPLKRVHNSFFLSIFRSCFIFSADTPAIAKF